MPPTVRSLSQVFARFREGIATGTCEPPDEYLDMDSPTQRSAKHYLLHRQLILEDWAAIKPKLKRDIERAASIEERLVRAIECFDRGERQPGRSLMMEIYNDLNQLGPLR